MRTRLPRLRLGALLVAIGLIAVACDCSDDATTTPSPAVPTTDGGPTEVVAGSVAVSGSSTVEPISSAVAEAFSAANPDVAISVDGPGTGDGFQLFCDGETDISNASRPIKDEEAEACAAAGIGYVELPVAIDGLTVATNPDNDSVECLDVPALYALVGPESQGFGNWSDAAALATELGSTITLPDASLDIFGPGEESGTYDTFVEFAVKDLAQERGVDDVTRPDYNSSPNDNVIVEGIEGSETSLGWVGFAFFTEQGDKMKGLAIDAGDGCVLPTAATVADGSYPFSRTLYIYVSTDSIADSAAVRAYVDYYLSDDGIGAVSQVGYVPLPADDLAATRAAWEAAV